MKLKSCRGRLTSSHPLEVVGKSIPILQSVGNNTPLEGLCGITANWPRVYRPLAQQRRVVTCGRCYHFHAGAAFCFFSVTCSVLIIHLIKSSQVFAPVRNRSDRQTDIFSFEMFRLSAAQTVPRNTTSMGLSLSLPFSPLNRCFMIYRYTIFNQPCWKLHWGSNLSWCALCTGLLSGSSAVAKSARARVGNIR